MTDSTKNTLFPPSATGLLSLLIPGLGQLFLGIVHKALIFIGSMATIIGLLFWRVHLLAHREIGWVNKFIKAFSRQPFFMTLVTLIVVGIWLWGAWDAYNIASKRRGGRKEFKGSTLIFGLILFQFFAIGWQIAEIDLYKMVSNFSDTIPPLLRILWPWEAAVDREVFKDFAEAKILVDDDENPPPVPEKVPGEPYIRVEPRFGNLSWINDQYETVPGDTITVYGEGFVPGTEVQIFWKDSIGNAFRPKVDDGYASVMPRDDGTFEYKMVMPYRLIPPSARGQQIHTVEGRQVKGYGPLEPSEPLILTIELIIETIFMGMMATFFGIIFSIPISFLAARNLMFGSIGSKIIYYLTRSVLNIVRAIEPLIWALIAVVWVGLGPFAGILALTIHTIAALGKLYSEAIENIDPGQIEAIQATGATRIQTIVHAVIPQMIPPFVSFTIYRWDINVRMSTVIGMVGGGGIGFLLVQYIRLLDYRSAGIAVWFIAITVSILDYVSAEIRSRFV